jgi:hypothetical protein
MLSLTLGMGDGGLVVITVIGKTLLGFMISPFSEVFLTLEWLGVDALDLRWIVGTGEADYKWLEALS